MLQDLTDTPVRIRVLASGERPLTLSEGDRLNAPGLGCQWRHGLLMVDGQAAASTTLTWNATDAQSCASSNNWSGTSATSGTQSTGPLTDTTEYSLLCTGPG